jgi:hypothetical protein
MDRARIRVAKCLLREETEDARRSERQAKAEGNGGG